MRKFLPLLLFPALIWSRDSWYAIGPMLHFNFGNGGVSTSLALEWSYWSYEETSPPPVESQGPYWATPQGRGYGLDIGAEWEFHLKGKGKLRLYSEAQVGWEEGLQGVALGPVMEVLPDFKNPRFGVQGSTWFPVEVVLLNLRARYIGDKFYGSPGLFLKIPAYDTPD